VANIIKLFRHNLHRYQHIALSFDPGYAANGVNYAKKVLRNWPQVSISKNFFSIIYSPSIVTQVKT
jgi:hypothetical protein